MAGIAVGVGERSDLSRITDYLSRRDVPIRHLSFDLFGAGEDLLLVRNVDPVEPERTRVRRDTQPVVSGPTALFAAESNAELREAIAVLSAAADAAGLHHRLYARAVMWSPPQHRSRMLFTLSANGPAGKLYCSADTFAEFYGTDPDAVNAVIGDPRGESFFVPEPDLLLRIAAGLPAWTKQPES